jgi:hypothetical protein
MSEKDSDKQKVPAGEDADRDGDELDEWDAEDELFDHRMIKSMERSNARLRLQARQTKSPGIVATLPLSANCLVIRLREIVPLLAKALGAELKKSVNQTKLLEKYAEQLQLAFAVGDLSPLDPETGLVVKEKGLDWDAMQEHFITRPQLEQFAHERLGIEIVDESDDQSSIQNMDMSAALDKRGAFYAWELDLAIRAWHALTVLGQPSTKHAVKTQILEWLDTHNGSLPKETKHRIATVCNWNKKGGAPRTGE